MIQERISQVIGALRERDIPARRAFSAGVRPELSGPAAAVAIHRVSTEETQLQILVYSPASLGGEICENAALAAAEALQALGAGCRQNACQFDRELGCFSVELLASWLPQAQQQALPYAVAVDGVVLPCVTSVTAKHTSSLSPVGQLGEGYIAMRWEKREWEILVEELLPPGAPITEAGVGTFTLEIRRENGIERYPKCRWLRLERKDTPQGVLQQRMAQSLEERVTVDGNDEV